MGTDEGGKGARPIQETRGAGTPTPRAHEGAGTVMTGHSGAGPEPSGTA